MKKLIFLSVVLLLQSPAFADCTLGDGEDTLSLHRVMAHFGKGVTAAGNLARDGMTDAGSIGEQDFVAARALVETARDCASVVLKDRIEALQPGKAKTMPAAEKQVLLDRFYGHMTGFESALNNVLQFLEEAKGQNPAEVNYETLQSKVKRIMELASAAHTDVG
jgi:hypothetical protein